MTVSMNEFRLPPVIGEGDSPLSTVIVQGTQTVPYQKSIQVLDLEVLCLDDVLDKM
jgi:hypothetical protein